MRESTKHIWAVAPVTTDSSGAAPARLQVSPAVIASPAEGDIKREASKLPLHVAIVASILEAGTEDRMRRACANVLIIGGGARIHNIGFAIESR